MGFNTELQISVYYICPLLEEEMVLCAVQVPMMRECTKQLISYPISYPISYLISYIISFPTFHHTFPTSL